MCVYVDVDEVMVEEWIAELGLDPADLRGSLSLVLRKLMMATCRHIELANVLLLPLRDFESHED